MFASKSSWLPGADPVTEARKTGLVLLLAMASALLAPAPAAAQAGIARPAPLPAHIDADTSAHRHAPLNYFFRSLIIPGWGQASLDRKLTGGLFIAFEGLAVAMAMKAGTELHYLERTDSATAVFRRGERQDWIVLVAFNHLFSGLEAYVSANLFDFPRDLKMRAIPLPGNRTGLGVTIGTPR